MEASGIGIGCRRVTSFWGREGEGDENLPTGRTPAPPCHPIRLRLSATLVWKQSDTGDLGIYCAAARSVRPGRMFTNLNRRFWLTEYVRARASFAAGQRFLLRLSKRVESSARDGLSHQVAHRTVPISFSYFK